MISHPQIGSTLVGTSERHDATKMSTALPSPKTRQRDNKKKRERGKNKNKIQKHTWNVTPVHENNMYGKCTVGDRWSSDQGSNANRPDGEGTWANRVTFGTAEAATSDDYKNPGYFGIAAQDVSVWHVPNNMVMENWSTASILRYHTENRFLTRHGGNLFNLFKLHQAPPSPWFCLHPQSHWLHLRQSSSTSDAHCRGTALVSSASSVSHSHQLSVRALGSPNYGSISVGHPPDVIAHLYIMAPPSFHLHGLLLCFH
ncbi:uncharacterized protein [Chanodichthys erythropterus]|uniref:uncharacterized protein n=1 Tax=Chanodichthys erythropterus TaxID=933992 RepID=UPI00351DC819